MRKVLAILFSFLVFGITFLTTVHSISDFREHFLHLFLIGGLSVFCISYTLKDTIKIRNRFSPFILLVLLTFSSIRIFPCHFLSSNLQSITHATITDHPCCSSITSTTTQVAIAPLAEKLAIMQEEPYVVQVPLYVNKLTNKSPPSLSA
jgi:hypothetical protein